LVSVEFAKIGKTIYKSAASAYQVSTKRKKNQHALHFPLANLKNISIFALVAQPKAAQVINNSNYMIHSDSRYIARKTPASAAMAARARILPSSRPSPTSSATPPTQSVIDYL
jgi:hypothetical protein